MENEEKNTDELNNSNNIENIDIKEEIETETETDDEFQNDIEEETSPELIENQEVISQEDFVSAPENDEKDENDEKETNETEKLITVRPVKFQNFEETPPIRTIKKNLDILQDVSMHISVELGRTKSSIKEVMEMEKGSIVELDKIAGEQVEVFVNGKLVAKGEVIVIEDKFGVRVTSTNFPKTFT